MGEKVKYMREKGVRESTFVGPLSRGVRGFRRLQEREEWLKNQTGGES